jgi:SchA/CurD like domain
MSEVNRYGILYPFKPGTAAQADELFRGGGDPPPQAAAQTALRSTTVLRKGDVVVRVFEIEGSLEEAIEHMVRASALSDLGEKLKPLLDESVDLTSEEGLRRFFADQMMEVVTHRAIPAR